MGSRDPGRDPGSGTGSDAGHETGRPAGVWLLAGTIGAAYSLLAVTNHVMLRTSGFDLGIFDQAVRSYARFRPPVADLKGPGFNLLGDHFHPIIAVLAPLYWLFPSAVTLLVAQALLFAASIVPVTRLGIERLGHRPGLMIGAAYGLSWGLEQAVWFDFHEIAFAVPLLALSLVALARQRWRAAAGWALPLLLVKEDMPLTVAAIGVYLALVGRRRWLGVGLVAVAVAVGLLAILVVIPTLNPGGAYPYSGSATAVAVNPFVRFAAPAIKWATIVLLLAPTVFLAVRSRLVLLALPTVAWRFWATTPAYWGPGFHYSAQLMPILFVSMIDSLTRLRARLTPARLTPGRPTPARLTPAGLVRGAPTLALALAVVSVGVVAAAHHDAIANWSLGAARADRTVLALIPDGATVSAANPLAPQLTDRATVYLFPAQTGPAADPAQTGPAQTGPGAAGPGAAGADRAPVAQWAAVARTQPWPLSDVELVETTSRLVGQGGYTLVASDGRVDLYRHADG